MRRFLTIAAFLVLPLAEVYVAAVLIRSFGWGPVLIAAALVFGFGIAMVRRAGGHWAAAVRRAQSDPTYFENQFARDFSDATLLMGGGVLMIIPGFITAGLGLLLVIPWTRRLLARPLAPSLDKFTTTRGYERITIIEGETVQRDGADTSGSGTSGTSGSNSSQPRIITGEIVSRDFGPDSNPPPHP